MPTQICEELLSMIKKTTRTRAEAKRLMWEYYRENKGRLTSSVRQYRELILDKLTLGQDPEDAFRIVS